MKLQFLAYILPVLLCTVQAPAQTNADARQILDRTAALFNTGQGIEARFNLTLTSNGRPAGSLQGSILLKGPKFYLETPSARTWFNGRTQWSYLPANEEVNVSNPTPEELQSINPYGFLQLYKQGYTCQPGQARTYQGKSIHCVELQAQQPQADIRHITLYIDRHNNQPLYIKISDKQKNCSEIEVLSIKKGLNLPDVRFEFDAKQHPQAEIIDLR